MYELWLFGLGANTWLTRSASL